MNAPSRWWVSAYAFVWNNATSLPSPGAPTSIIEPTREPRVAKNG